MYRTEVLTQWLPRTSVRCIDDYLIDSILVESDKRYCLFPLQYPAMHELWQNGVNTFWNPQEILLKKDLHDWNQLTKEEKFYIKYTLAFFASSDNIVAENILGRFSTEVQVPEIRMFYALQAAQESIHSVTYNMLIEAFVPDLKERNDLFLAIRTHPMIKQKAQWAIKWITDDAPFVKRLVAFAIVEMVFFSSAFCSIFWLKKRGVMPGLTLSNEWISRDEASHCRAAWIVYAMLQPENRMSTSELHTLMSEAIVVESASVRDSLPVALIGMNADAMIQYVKFCADLLLVELNAPKLFHVTNPFPWMELISMPGKTNFFERINADYMKISGVKNNVVGQGHGHGHNKGNEHTMVPQTTTTSKEEPEDDNESFISSDF